MPPFQLDATTTLLPVPAFHVLARVRNGDPGSPTVVLALGPGAERRWRAAISELGGAFASVASLDILVASAEEHAMLPVVPEVDAALRIAIAGDVLRDRPELARSLEVDPQRLAALLAGLCDEAALHGLHRVTREVVDALEGSAVVRSRVRLLHSVLLAYRTELATRGVDLIARLERATTALASAPRREFPLIVDGASRLRPLERELVAALGRAGAEVAVVEPAPVRAAEGTLLRDLLTSDPGTVSRVPDGSFVRVTCRDALEEAEAAARLVIARLAEGDPPERLAIQVPRGVGYGDLLSRVFAGHGLSLSATDSLGATSTPLYQVFRAFVRLFYRGPDPFDLAAIFGASGSGVRGGRRDAIGRELLRSMPPSWDDVREAIRAATGAADPPQEGAPPRPEEEVTRHGEAREAALAIVAVLERGPSGRRVEDPLLAARALREAVLWFCAGIGSAHRLLPVLGVPDRDARVHSDAAGAIRGAATLLAERAVEGTPVAAAFRDSSSFLQAMEALLPDVAEPVASGAIRLRFGDDAEGPVDHLILVGFSRGRWPAPAASLPLLGTLERETLRRLGGGLAELPLPEDAAVRNAGDARAVLAQSAKSVVVLTPARSESGAEAPPALLLVDLLRRMDDPTRLAWRRAHEVRLGTPEAGALWSSLGPDLPPRSTARHALQAAARALGGGAALAARERAAVGRLLTEGRAGPLASPWLPDAEFELPVPLDVAAHEFSPSQLEALVSCRYRYFTRYVLGLSRLDLVRSPALSVATTGDIAHHVLEALGDRLTTAGEDAIRAALADVLAQLYPWALDARYRSEVAAVERELLSFVPAYQETVRGMGWDEGASEVPFGESQGKPVTLALDRGQPEALRTIGVDRLKLQGRIDRVDRVLVQGKPFRLITDFKFGNVQKYLTQREVGMGLQAALYPAALVQLGGPPPLGFVYFSLTSRRGNLLPSRAAPLPDALGAIDLDSRDLETFQAEVAQLLTARLALLLGESRSGGQGDVTPHSIEERERLEKARADSCRYCDAWLLCRFEEVS